MNRLLEIDSDCPEYSDDVHETDVAMASIFRTSLNWFAPGNYSIAYIEDSIGTPYFDRFALQLLVDGFESGDTSAWSQTVP